MTSVGFNTIPNTFSYPPTLVVTSAGSNIITIFSDMFYPPTLGISQTPYEVLGLREGSFLMVVLQRFVQLYFGLSL